MSQNRNGSNPLAATKKENWRTLAEKASNEMDPKKLVDLVQRLGEELDRHGSANKSSETSPRQGRTEPLRSSRR